MDPGQGQEIYVAGIKTKDQIETAMHIFGNLPDPWNVRVLAPSCVFGSRNWPTSGAIHALVVLVGDQVSTKKERNILFAVKRTMRTALMSDLGRICHPKDLPRLRSSFGVRRAYSRLDVDGIGPGPLYSNDVAADRSKMSDPIGEVDVVYFSYLEAERQLSLW